MQTEGANDRVQLAELGRELNRRIVTRWMRDGVTVMDPATTWIDADVVLAADVTILPGTQLLGATVVGEDAVVGPDTTLKDCEIGAGARVVRTHGELAVIGAGGERRPVLPTCAPAPCSAPRGKIGGFVETKNAVIGDGRQGAAPVVRRRRRDRRGHQHRRRHDLRQLRRGREAPHDGRQARPHGVATTPSSPPSTSGTARPRARAPSSVATCRRARSPSAADRSATSRAGRSGDEPAPPRRRQRTTPGRARLGVSGRRPRVRVRRERCGRILTTTPGPDDGPSNGSSA